MNAPLESELHMFADDRLDSHRAMEIRAWLADRPDEQAAVNAWRAQKKALRGAFDGILEQPIPERLYRSTRAVRARGPRRLVGILASIVLLGVGGVAGYLLHGANLPASPSYALFDLSHQAIMAHALYTPEVRHPVEVSAAQEAHLVQWLSKRMDYPLSVPRLASLGFELIGGRLLPSETGAAAQFMYQNQAGQRLTLYLRRNPSNRETGFHFVRENSVSVFYWIDGSLGCALSGDMPREALLALAERVYEQLFTHEPDGS